MRSGAQQSVRQDDDVVALPNAFLGARTYVFNGLFHIGNAAIHTVSDIEGLGLKLVVSDITDRTNLLQTGIGDNRLTHLKALERRCPLKVQQIWARPNKGHQRHHDLFTDRINWRVRHLRKELLKIGRQMLGLGRKRR